MDKSEGFGRKENTTLKTNRQRHPRSTASSVPNLGFFEGFCSSTYEHAHEQHNKGRRIKFSHATS